LERGNRVLTATDDFTYRRFANGSGSVGAQFRHILDFVGSLLRGIEKGRIDYTDRQRDTRVETDRQYAFERSQTLLRELHRFDQRVMGKTVLVRSELDEATWLASSVAREVEFVHSHTVHHHALIAEKLAGFGVVSDAGLGVSPSTLEYRKQMAA
jgi:hypothetical protein